jgi:hypothetical protein
LAAFEAEFDGSPVVSKLVFTEWLAERQGTRDFMTFFNTAMTGKRFTVAESLGLNMRFLLNHKIETTTIFKALETAKQQGLVDDYSLTQYTLEQIFNTLAANSANPVRSVNSGHHPDDSE